MTFLGPPVYVLKGSWLKMPNLGLLVKPIRAFLQKSPKMSPPPLGVPPLEGGRKKFLKMRACGYSKLEARDPERNGTIRF